MNSNLYRRISNWVSAVRRERRDIGLARFLGYLVAPILFVCLVECLVLLLLRPDRSNRILFYAPLPMLLIAGIFLAYERKSAFLQVVGGVVAVLLILLSGLTWFSWHRFTFDPQTINWNAVFHASKVLVAVFAPLFTFVMVMNSLDLKE